MAASDHVQASKNRLRLMGRPQMESRQAAVGEVRKIGRAKDDASEAQVVTTFGDMTAAVEQAAPQREIQRIRTTPWPIGCSIGRGTNLADRGLMAGLSIPRLVHAAGRLP